MATALLPVAATALVWRFAAGIRSAAGCALPRLLGLAATRRARLGLAQHKGWSYHILPIELFACGLGGVLAARWLDRLGGVPVSPPHAYPAAAALAGLFALYAISNGEAPWKELDYRRQPGGRLTQLLAAEAAGERVLVLSPGIYPIYPALNYVGAHHTCAP